MKDSLLKACQWLSSQINIVTLKSEGRQSAARTHQGHLEK